jgi:hypothetical protein
LLWGTYNIMSYEVAQDVVVAHHNNAPARHPPGGAMATDSHSTSS